MRFPVDDEEYVKIMDFVERLSNDQEYIFNYVSALFMFTFGGVKSYKAYHCIEFVSEILSLTQSVSLPRQTHKMKPMDLYHVLKPFMIYSREIHLNDFEHKNNEFMKQIRFSILAKKSLYCVKESICRAVLQRTSKNFDYLKVNFYDDDIVE